MDKKSWFKVLHYGALWGIAEATLGYALHAFPIIAGLRISGSIMFPIGVLCMYNAFKKTDKSQAILLTAVVAAAIKSVNFLMPATNVFNPMMAIVIEGLAVLLIMPAMLGNSTRLITLFSMGFAASVVWRIPFLYVPFLMKTKGMWQMPPERWVPFLTVTPFFSGLFIAGFLALAIRFPLKGHAEKLYEKVAFAPAGLFATICVAFALEVFIR